jgi:hydroxyacylglutathione hydrolase
MLHVDTIPVTEFGQNCRILWCSETKECVIVDPGGEAEKILGRVEKLGVSPKQIWLTHSHLDHCAAVAPLMKKLSVALVGHPAEKMLRNNVGSFAQMYGMDPSEWPNCPEPSIEVVGGEEVCVGNCKAQVLFTPGHSPGHVSFYFPQDSILASGDVLFKGSIGRTDLPGGDMKTLVHSIHSKIFTLPGNTRVLCGHGEDTTIAEEQISNPFVGKRAS